MQNNINLSAEAIKAIEALQHKNGTFDYYRETLSRLKTYVLHQGDEIGMSDTKSIHTLRALDDVISDLAAIAGSTVGRDFDPESPADIAERVDRMFEDDDISDSTYPTELDEPREMIYDVTEAWKRINQTAEVISEAIRHASKAGEKYNSVAEELHDINGSLEPVIDQLDAIIAIDPDSYNPKEPTYMEKTALALERAADTLRAGEEILIDAIEYAKFAGIEPDDDFFTKAQSIDSSLEDSISDIKMLHKRVDLNQTHTIAEADSDK